MPATLSPEPPAAMRNPINTRERRPDPDVASDPVLTGPKAPKPRSREIVREAAKLRWVSRLAGDPECDSTGL